MSILHFPTLLSFLAFTGLGTYVFLRNRRNWVNIFFALGMGCLALMEFGNLMALIQAGAGTALFWKRISLVGECLVPLAWLVFCLSFARKDTWQSSKEWKWVIMGVGIISALFIALILSGVFVSTGDSSEFLPLDRIGKVFYIFFLICLVAILAVLEHTIRQTKGVERIRIKGLVLGMCGLFAFLIYVGSQNLLFSGMNLAMVPVSSSAFVICVVLMGFSVVRHRIMDVNLYISRFVIYNSLTILVVGAYLVLVGVAAQVIRSFEILSGHGLEILFLFVAILILLAVVLSDRIRWKARMLINKHFYRSRYDYREEWLKLSQGLSLKLDIEELISTVTAVLQDSIGVKDVSLWLSDRNSGELRLTGRSSSQEKSQLKMDQSLSKVLVEKRTPFSFETPWANSFVLENSDIFNSFRTSLFVPMVSGTEIVGLILLGKKTTGEPFLGDDIDFLRSAAAQIASAIVNARLSQELVETKGMEVFHRFSSFVMHDLKNLVSNLSLVVQNAGQHMRDAEFQHDALETVAKSVGKMETLIGRLSNNTIELKLDLQKASLNDVVLDVVGRMEQNGRENKATVQTDLGAIPLVLADREQIEKVVENLLLNAFQTLDDGGLIAVKTEADNDRVVLSVSDNGPGMSQEFVNDFLFRPFTSTKKKGLGIGLYQCKTIVEGHQGRIEVESEEGKGSTFRVILPVVRGA